MTNRDRIAWTVILAWSAVVMGGTFAWHNVQGWSAPGTLGLAVVVPDTRLVTFVADNRDGVYLAYYRKPTETPRLVISSRGLQTSNGTARSVRIWPHMPFR